jgi:hypothetical protein
LFEICFDIEFLQKHFHGVFEFPLPRNNPKRTLKKIGRWVGANFLYKKSTIKTDFFLDSVLLHFWAFLSEGSSKAPKNNIERKFLRLLFFGL